jgi:hypothetical protein
VASYPVPHPEVVRTDEFRHTMTRKYGRDLFRKPKGGWYRAAPTHIRKLARARFPHIIGRVHPLHGAVCRGYLERLAGATGEECPYRTSQHGGASRAGGTFGYQFVDAWQRGHSVAGYELKTGEPDLEAWERHYVDYCDDLANWKAWVPADPLDPESKPSMPPGEPMTAKGMGLA